jgi:hypothetical protein
LFALLLIVGATTKTTKQSAAEARVKRGAYLVTIMACDDCHTPMKMGPNGPEPDMSRRLSGHPEMMKMPPAPAMNGPWVWAGAGTNTAFAGPWGVSYTANLTPDPQSGLGSAWNEERFIQAIRTGKHIGSGRPINPPMPWPSYRHASDEDLKAIWAFLRTVKPMKNFVPDYQPPPARPAH